MELAFVLLIVLLAQLYLALSLALPLLDGGVASVLLLLFLATLSHHAFVDQSLKLVLMKASRCDYLFLLLGQIIVEIPFGS